MHPDAPPKLTEFNVADDFRHLSLPDLRILSATRALPYAVAMANVTGDLNMGVIVRSACILGAERVYMFGRRKYDRRSTVGAHHYIPIVHVEMDWEDGIDWDAMLRALRVDGYTPVLIEQGGEPLYTWNVALTPGRVCLVMGPERDGIPEDVVVNERCYSIPQPGILRSLNVSTAASIAMYHTMCGLMPR